MLKIEILYSILEIKRFVFEMKNEFRRKNMNLRFFNLESFDSRLKVVLLTFSSVITWIKQVRLIRRKKPTKQSYIP